MQHVLRLEMDQEIIDRLKKHNKRKSNIQQITKRKKPVYERITSVSLHYAPYLTQSENLAISNGI